MANNNVQNVRFLRNGNLFTSRQAGLDALNGFTLTAEMDGSSILARYSGTTTGESQTTYIKTLVGYVYYKDASNKSITIFDIDDAGSDVDEKIKAAIEALDYNATSSDGKNVQVKVTETDGKITAVNITTDNTVNSGDVDTAITNAINELDGSVIAETGYFVKSVTEADGKISGTTEALPSVNAISEAGKPITAVSESLGSISATAGTINAEYVDVSYSAITATNVKGALAEIADEIDAMDKAAAAEDGKVVTTVSETDGVVSETKANVKDLQLGGYSKSSSTGAIASTDTINEALSKLENKAAAITVTPKDKSIVVETTDATTEVGVNIRSGERVLKLDTDATSGGIYTNLNLVEITGETLPAEIKVRYELRDSDNIKIGESIDIPKDSHIVSISYDENTQELVYTYIDVSGATKTTKIDLSHLVLEAEFASGVTFSDGVAHGVVDPTSENFLTVGANGFKLAGVQTAINSAIEALDATGGTQTIATDKHVAVEVIEADGKITTVTVVEDDIASADALADEITARGNADTELSNRLGTGVTTENTATEQLAALVGTTADTKDSSSIVGAKKYTDDKVATIIDGLDATVSGESADHKVNVKVTEANGVITAVDVVGTDIASASALTAEIAARKDVDGQSGQTYAANTEKVYISGATSLNDADIKLNDALASLDADVIKSVKVNNIALAEEANAVNVQISAAAGTGAASTPITVDTNNSTGAITLKLEGLDCGTY